MWRYVEQFARCGGQFLVAQKSVGSTEINGLGGNLLDSAAAADGLVIELDRFIDLGVLAEPF